MKKTFLIITLLGSVGMVVGSEPSWFQRTFGRSSDTPGSYFGSQSAAPSSSAPAQPGFFERTKQRLGFGQERPLPISEPTGFRRVGESHPTLPQDKPGFFDRTKQRFGFGSQPVAPQAAPSGFGPSQPGARQGLAGASREFLEGVRGRTGAPSAPLSQDTKQLRAFADALYNANHNMTIGNQRFQWYAKLSLPRTANRNEIEAALRRSRFSPQEQRQILEAWDRQVFRQVSSRFGSLIPLWNAGQLKGKI